MQTILIIEDEPSVAENISYALKTEGFNPVCCATGTEGLDYLKSAATNLIVLDVGLPDINGFDLCHLIREISKIPIIFLTARGDEIDRIVGLEIGADDYMVKPFSPRELTARIRAVLRRAVTDSTVQNDQVPAAFVIDEACYTIHYDGQLLPLTRYEFRMLELFIKRPGRVFSRDVLMEQVWEEPDASMDRTVDTHIKSLRAKLRAVRSEDDSIQTHRGLGYSFKDPFV